MGLATDLALCLDAVLLAQQAGITPDPWQAKVLRSSAPRVLLNCSRQSGKSTITAILALHTALFQPGALVLLLSPALRQSSELFRKCADVYRRLDRPVSPEAESALRLELANGSRIISLPGTENTVRGFSGVRLLVVDEAARVEDALFLSIVPMLAVSVGRLVALSTPFGSRGWWHDAWCGSEPWERYEVPATMCPRIPPVFLDEAKRTMGEWWFSQEFLCRFMDAETAAFRREDVDRAFSSEVQPWAL